MSAQFVTLIISALPAAVKRWRKGCQRERTVAKPKPTLNLVLYPVTSSSTVQSPIASKSPGTLRAPCQQDWKSTGKLVAREPNQDAASSSQVWQKDAEMDKSTTRLVASGNSDIDGIGTVWPHNLLKYIVYVPSLEKVFSNVRQQYGLKPGDKMENLDVNAIIWRMFISVTLQAAVHLGKD